MATLCWVEHDCLANEYGHLSGAGAGCLLIVSGLASPRSPTGMYGWLAAMYHGVLGQCCVLAAGSSEQGMPGYSYEPSDLSGWIWNRDRSVGSLGRAYNYPHQVCVCCIQPLHSSAACALCNLLLLNSCAVPEGQLRLFHRQQPDPGCALAVCGVLEPVQSSQGAGHQGLHPPRYQSSCTAAKLVPEASCTYHTGTVAVQAWRTLLMCPTGLVHSHVVFQSMQCVTLLQTIPRYVHD